MRIIYACFCTVFTVIFVFCLQTKFDNIPAVGAFLNPTTGFWQNAESAELENCKELTLHGLLEKVTIKYDEQRIPHIFAYNDHDLYFAQGYLTAKDRLWQMDIQTRSASGRLAEVLGDRALADDIYHRNMGMVFGAENTLKKINADPVIRLVVQSYTDGVNAYIENLSVKDYPIEFKLLNYAPERWKPIYCVMLLKLMSETLAGSSNEMSMTNVLNKFGILKTNDLFPNYQLHEEPIIPKGTKWNFKPISVLSKVPELKMGDMPKTHNKMKVEGIGSNNWVVNGNKTKSGFPILANDPHLNLTYPSIWYQMQLASPKVNVCGVSIPGAPGIIIGFNDKISWGITNVDADVLDWYQIKFNQQKTKFWYNNKWNAVNKRLEYINVLGKKTVIDTVLYTIQGPVVYKNFNDTLISPSNIPIGYALRWIAHDGSNEFKTFYLLNRGRNYADYRQALSFYSAPAQNFAFAAKDNDIAITSSGKFPLKYKNQGKFLLDGSDPNDDWHGWIPFDQNPSIKNPARNFLSSANQSPTDPTYPYYINWQFASYARAKRINDRLVRMNCATVDSMRILQTDTYSITAQDILPTLLDYLAGNENNENEKVAIQELRKWNNCFEKNSIAATIFNLWCIKFHVLTWDDEFGDKKTPLNYPSMERTEALLLHEPNSIWFDNKRTSVRESCSQIIFTSFRQAIRELVVSYGNISKSWEWGKVKKIKIAHIGGINAFGSQNLITGGTGSTINALTDGHGPSWRMVVEMGPEVKGYGIIPGGESGNPGSFYYDNMLQCWEKGELKELLFLKTSKEKSSRIKSTLILVK